jgi:hypothetical protein
VTIALQVNEVSPAKVVAVVPSAIPVDPIVIELFANCALGMALVPNSPLLLLYVSPEPAATLTCARASAALGPV